MATEPSLALIPSGIKASKVYSVLPIDGTGDFDFSRASGATRVNSDGLIEDVADNVPRLDWYDSNCPSLLLEPQRTNLQVLSEDFNSGFWVSSQTRLTITTNDTISPNGELTADKLTGDGTGPSYIYDAISCTSGLKYAISIFVKKLNVSTFVILNFTETGTATFNLENGTSTGISGSLISQDIENYGNGWYRCSAIYNCTSTGNKNIGYGLQNYLGDQFYLWGAQVEQGSYPTSYIKTEASTVTRLKDECLNGGDIDLFNITEGTFFVDATPYDSGNVTVIGLSIGNDTQKIIFQFQTNGTQVRIFSSGGVSSYLSLTFNQRNKIAVTFKENEYKFFINGALVGSDTSATVPTGMDRLNFSNRTNTGNHFEGKVYDARVYDRVLTEAEAIELTTL